MKKWLLIAAFAIFGLGTSNAQGMFNAGVNLGIPMGDADAVSGFNAGLELNYMFTVSDGFTLGPSLEYSMFFGKEDGGIDYESVSFLPISAAARFNITDDFIAGANIGYGIGLGEGPLGIADNDGGFYYRPMLGYKIGDNTQLNLSYSSIDSNGANWASFAVGIMFGL